MTIQSAYQQLRIPPNLQEHMLRVGALLHLLVNNWRGVPINQQELVTAGLFHDAGNIIKFDFSKTELFGNQANQIDYWRQVQAEFVRHYGSNVHAATKQICEELNLSSDVIKIIEELEWDRIPVVLKNQDWPVALAIYADTRIGPFGILSLQDRIDNLHQRNPLAHYQQLIDQANNLEQTLRPHLLIDLKLINDQDLASLFTQLLQMDI